jgi:hypothetical protein
LGALESSRLLVRVNDLALIGPSRLSFIQWGLGVVSIERSFMASS